jgi:hypothetical protein
VVNSPIVFGVFDFVSIMLIPSVSCCRLQRKLIVGEQGPTSSRFCSECSLCPAYCWHISPRFLPCCEVKSLLRCTKSVDIPDLFFGVMIWMSVTSLWIFRNSHHPILYLCRAYRKQQKESPARNPFLP